MDRGARRAAVHEFAKESDTTEAAKQTTIYAGRGLCRGLSGKESACHCPRHRSSGFLPSNEDPLEEEMATCSNILAWKIPWTEEPGRLQPITQGCKRVRHN